MSQYNPELLLKYDEVRAKKDEGGFFGEMEMKRSEHQRAKVKRYALAYNFVHVQFRFEKPYRVDTRFGERWIFRLKIADADPDKHELTFVENDGSYFTSWFAPVFKLTQCKACGKNFSGKHVDKCDCGSTNVKNIYECRSEADFAKVMSATGYDPDRWNEFTYRMTVKLTDKGYPRYSIDLVSGPKDAAPRKGRNLTEKPPVEEIHFPKEIKKKLERQLVPVVKAMAKQGQSVTLEDWVATLIQKDIGVESEAEAERLWEFRAELKGWPEKM